LHGRISRSVEGFVKFLKVTFSDFMPAVLMASFALITAIRRTGVSVLVMLVRGSRIDLHHGLAGEVARKEFVALTFCKANEGLDGTVLFECRLGGPSREYPRR
jgi:ATP-binding cassette subfamily B protein